MGAEMAVVLLVLIVCLTILVGLHMYYCNENEIGMFANPKYDKRINELERAVKELKQDR